MPISGGGTDWDVYTNITFSQTLTEYDRDSGDTSPADNIISRTGQLFDNAKYDQGVILIEILIPSYGTMLGWFRISDPDGDITQVVYQDHVFLSGWYSSRGLETMSIGISLIPSADYTEYTIRIHRQSIYFTGSMGTAANMQARAIPGITIRSLLSLLHKKSQ